MELILEKLKCQKNRPSTMANYLSVWRKFNNFVMKLDQKPKFWEDRASLFGAALGEKGIQSSTLKSYMSVIKWTLINDNYPWDDDRVTLNTLMHACRVINDRVNTRLLIHSQLLDLLIFEVQRRFTNQPFLETMYRTWFHLAYYGLFRVGELAYSTHVVRAKDVHIARNKQKLLFILYTSKTHGHESHPQKIKITAVSQSKGKMKEFGLTRFFCPFEASREYLTLRGNYITDSELFFVHRDNSPVTPEQIRNMLKSILQDINLDARLYNTH